YRPTRLVVSFEEIPSMSQAVEAGSARIDGSGSEFLARYREARAKDTSEKSGRPSLGTKIIFDTLQYAMFDNVAEAFHFHADLNPDLTHVKQPVIHQWTEGEKHRPLERLSAAEFQRREQKIAHYLRSVGVRAGQRVAIISAEGPFWAAF